MTRGLTVTERRLLDRLQQGFPLEEEPYRRLAGELGLRAEEVVSLTEELCRRGLVRRLGPVYDARSLGYLSTLLAVEVAEEGFDQVACRINAFPEVTHNYQREHQWNLWCTVLATSEDRLREIVASIREIPGVERLLELPVRRRYKLRLVFPLAQADEADHAG